MADRNAKGSDIRFDVAIFAQCKKSLQNCFLFISVSRLVQKTAATFSGNQLD